MAIFSSYPAGSSYSAIACAASEAACGSVFTPFLNCCPRRINTSTATPTAHRQNRVAAPSPIQIHLLLFFFSSVIAMLLPLPTPAPGFVPPAGLLRAYPPLPLCPGSAAARQGAGGGC